MKQNSQKAWKVYGIALLVLLGLGVFFFHRAAALYTDWLWHRALGTQIVYYKVYGSRVFLFCVFGATSFFLAYFNVWLADRISPPTTISTPNHVALFPALDGKPIGRTIQTLSGLRHVLDVLLLIGAFIFAVLAGLSAQAEWDSFLRFTHPEPFGIGDPEYGKDIGFYIFSFPFLRFVQGWSLSITLLIGAGVATVYLYQQGINRAAGNMVVLPHVRGHLSAVFGTAFLLQAWGYSLDRYSLLFGGGGLPGAYYTEIHAKLPFLLILPYVALLSAVASFVNVWRKTLTLPIIAISLWVLISGIAWIWPFFYYRMTVTPNEASLEAPYLERAIRATSAGYGLSEMTVVDWKTTGQPPAVRADDSAFLSEFPFWDARPLGQSLQVRQGFRQYLTVSEPETDRYHLGSTLKLTQTAVRDIAVQRLDSRAYSWPNLHLRYTHGYGAVAVAGNTEDGGANYLLADIPPQTAVPELTIREPRIYFGSVFDNNDYAIVNTRLSEAEFAETSQNPSQPSISPVKTGIRLTPLTRLAFTARFATLSLLLSSEITPNSRLLFARNISVRVKRIAPFLRLDTNPCPVILKGRLLWMLNAFTTADTYPYSALSVGSDNLSAAETFNYVRPSVTATVDAFDGTVRLYVTDFNDPIIRSYIRTFPTLFHAWQEMPSALQAHRRYPPDLFEAQRHILTEFHTTNPDTLYSRNDVWRVPLTTLPATKPGVTRTAELPPYYAVTRLQEGENPEFVLLSPFTPAEKTNLTAVFIARCDPPHFGELYLYRFGSQSTMPGTEQMERRVKTDARITSFLSQAETTGEVNFGDLRMVPIDGKRLYYLQSVYVKPTKDDETDSLRTVPPQLRRIVVASANQMGIGTTFASAFDEIGPLGQPIDRAKGEFSAPVLSLIRKAGTLYQQAQEALRSGDFATYGRINAELGQILKKLQTTTLSVGTSETPTVQRTLSR